MKDHYYPQICITAYIAPTFPDKCPLCEADGKDGEYKCGGRYHQIAQFQNHTDKYNGHCPLTYRRILSEQKKLECAATVWRVHENGERILVASFEDASLAQDYTLELSKESLYRFSQVSKLDYLEVAGRLGFAKGYRYKGGKQIGQLGSDGWERIEQINSYSFKNIGEWK